MLRNVCVTSPDDRKHGRTDREWHTGHQEGGECHEEDRHHGEARFGEPEQDAFLQGLLIRSWARRNLILRAHGFCCAAHAGARRIPECSARQKRGELSWSCDALAPWRPAGRTAR